MSLVGECLTMSPNLLFFSRFYNKKGTAGGDEMLIIINESINRIRRASVGTAASCQLNRQRTLHGALNWALW